MALKALMYVLQFALYVAASMGLFWLGRGQPIVAAFFAMLFLYTMAGIVFATDYGSGILAVPRYAFSIMPFLVMLAGVSLTQLRPSARA